MVRGDLEIKMLWFFSMYEVIDIDRPQKLLRTTEAFVGKKSFGKKETHSSLSFFKAKMLNFLHQLFYVVLLCVCITFLQF